MYYETILLLPVGKGFFVVSMFALSLWGLGFDMCLHPLYVIFVIFMKEICLLLEVLIY